MYIHGGFPQNGKIAGKEIGYVIQSLSRFFNSPFFSSLAPMSNAVPVLSNQ